MWWLLIAIFVVILVFIILFVVFMTPSACQIKLGQGDLSTNASETSIVYRNPSKLENLMRAVIQMDQTDSRVIPEDLLECYPIYVDVGALFLDSFDTNNPTWITLQSFVNLVPNIIASIQQGQQTPYIRQNLQRFINILMRNANRMDFELLTPQNATWAPGLIMPSLNQGQCGSCWVFSSASATSDRYRIEFNRGNISSAGDLMNTIYYRMINDDNSVETSTTGGEDFTQTLNTISPFELGSCSNVQRFYKKTDTGIDTNILDPTPSQSCDPSSNIPCNTGGYPDNAMNYLRLVGAKETLYGNRIYDSNTYTCPSCDNGKYSVCDYIQFGAYGGKTNVNDIIYDYKKELYANGPFVVSFLVFDSFYRYITGIYSPISGEPQIGGHAVTLIGWTTFQGTPCWIVRNSWGASWGMNGNFLISFNDANTVGMYGIGVGEGFRIVAPLISCPSYVQAGCKINTLSSHFAVQGLANCTQCPLFK